jgi:hypothetical protein
MPIDTQAGVYSNYGGDRMVTLSGISFLVPRARDGFDDRRRE